MGRVLGFYSLAVQPCMLTSTQPGGTLNRLHMCPKGQEFHEKHVNQDSKVLYFLASPLPSSSLPTS